MRTVFLDCGMGAAGDMLSAALLELHDAPETVLEVLNAAFDGRAVISVEKQKKCGILGSHMTVHIGNQVEGEAESLERNVARGEHVPAQNTEPGMGENSHFPHGEHPDNRSCVPPAGHDGHHHHTTLEEVRAFIGALPLPVPVIRDALAVYGDIARAEAAVHGQTMENIHFHEVGTMDAMADVVTVCYLMHELKPERVLATPVHVGSGTVHCAHGELPVPAPATAELLKGIPIFSGEIRGELCTPTGAALLRHFVTGFGKMPPLRILRIGYGLGTKEFPRANALRALLCETEEAPDEAPSADSPQTLSSDSARHQTAAGSSREKDPSEETVLELVCNLDDMTAEELAFAQEQLLDAGALDVYFTGIGMKKSRPAVMLTCLCHEEAREAVLRCMFLQTETLGIRERRCVRYTLNRSEELRETQYGPVRIKKASGRGVSREKAEYEDLRRIAKENGISLREAREAAAR